MTAARLSHDGNDRMNLSGELDADSVPGLLRTTRNAFHKDREMTINLADVTRADSAGVALLLDWLRQARAAQSTLHYHNTPQQMRDMIHFCALEQVLPLG